MITFTITLSTYTGLVSPFEMGDIEIVNDATKISSKKKIPDQSMMIFLSLCDLIDKIKAILLSKSHKITIFSGVDSSFSLQISCVKNVVFIKNNDSVISCSAHDLGKAIYEQSVSFYQLYAPKLEEEHKYYDLKQSISEFSEFLKKS